MKWFNWRVLLQIHVYLGLFCLPYLLIFALSSLNFTHHFFNESKQPEVEIQELLLQMPAIEDNREMANALIDSLNLFGWYHPWGTRRDSLQFVTSVGQPGRELSIFYSWESGETTLRTRRKRVGGLLRSMHFLGESIPHAPWWVNLWQYYQAFTAYAMLFWTASGIYLWARKSKRPREETLTLFGFALVSVSLVLYLWLVG